MYWLAGDVKEPTHFSQRVGYGVPGVVVWPSVVSRVGASYRVNLIALFPLEITRLRTQPITTDIFITTNQSELKTRTKLVTGAKRWKALVTSRDWF